MSPHSDVYEDVTQRILKALDEGVAPWRQPWQSLGAVNVRSGKPYRGINTLLLGLQGCDDPRWGTFKAWKEKGASVKRGEHGTRIVFWKRCDKKGVALAEAEREGKPTAYSLLRSYVVFNAEQVENAPALEMPAHEFQPLAEAQAVLDDYFVGDTSPTLGIGGDSAYYLPSDDLVQLPAQRLFSDDASWYAVAFHEMAHSAGAENRCGGLVPATFGSDPYAREELVAEISAAMLGATCNLGASLETSAAYLQGWRQRISEEPRLIVSAAAEAQRRCDHIRGIGWAEAADSEQLLAVPAAALEAVAA